jgi:hypothetical protein
MRVYWSTISWSSSGCGGMSRREWLLSSTCSVINIRNISNVIYWDSHTVVGTSGPTSNRCSRKTLAIHDPEIDSDHFCSPQDFLWEVDSVRQQWHQQLLVLSACSLARPAWSGYSAKDVWVGDITLMLSKAFTTLALPFATDFSCFMSVRWRVSQCAFATSYGKLRHQWWPVFTILHPDFMIAFEVIVSNWKIRTMFQRVTFDGNPNAIYYAPGYDRMFRHSVCCFFNNCTRNMRNCLILTLAGLTAYPEATSLSRHSSPTQSDSQWRKSNWSSPQTKVLCQQILNIENFSWISTESGSQTGQIACEVFMLTNFDTWPQNKSILSWCKLEWCEVHLPRLMSSQSSHSKNKVTELYLAPSFQWI